MSELFISVDNEGFGEKEFSLGRLRKIHFIVAMD